MPIRVYGGLNPDGDLDATAADVVAELDRTNAWDRSILVVATTTGTGWIDPGMSDSLEFMHGGDTAIATMQYSYLPSWISFIGDRSTPPAAGKALFEAVYAKWSTLPEATRPKLIAQGISLGSFGMQGAFSGIQDLTERTDGALFLGTPSFTEMWADLTDNRDPGSLERQPVVDNGKDVRWGEQIADGINLHLPRRRLGRTRGWSTCNTRPTASSGGPPACCGQSRIGSANLADPTSSTRWTGTRW